MAGHILTTHTRNIAIALSGGGIRAAIFHFGVLTRLSETDLWEHVTHISTVSGGSLCAARLFAHAKLKWPSVDEFNTCLSETYELVTTYDLQRAYVLNTLIKPWRLLHGRAYLIAKLLEEKWDISGCLTELPSVPRWHICTTCFESGKNWRFSKKRMGDYVANYVESPKFPISSAVASSAAVPGLIGPLKIDTAKFKWKRFSGSTLVDTSPIGKALTLWDGGVYDNLGIEALYKIGSGPREDIDFLLISDASAPLAIKKRTWIEKIPLPGSPTRLVDIPTDQIRSVRSREIFHTFQNHRNGGYIKIGETVGNIFRNLDISAFDSNYTKFALTADEVNAVASFKTTLRRLKPEEFEIMFRHGYESCSAVLFGAAKLNYRAFDRNKYAFLSENSK